MNRLRGMITAADEIASADTRENANSAMDTSDCLTSSAEISALHQLDNRRAAAVLASVDYRRCTSIQAPLHYERGYRYPLLIWLHGDGGDEQQLQFVMPHISLRNYVAAAPRGTASVADERFDDGEPGTEGFFWRQDDDHIFLAQDRIAHCIELACERYNVHPERVFLAGYQSGGTMALRIALSDPDRFAGAISMCGPLPTGGAPFGRFVDARRVAVMIAAGLSDRSYPQWRVFNDLRLLHIASVRTTLRFYPGADELTDLMLDHLNCWVMEQVCPPSSSVAKAR